jgi:hypothetical protein
VTTDFADKILIMNGHIDARLMNVYLTQSKEEK